MPGPLQPAKKPQKVHVRPSLNLLLKVTFKWVRLLYLPDVAVSQRIEDLIHHAVIHVLQRRWHPADIQLALLTCAAHCYISRGIQKNCTQT